MAQLKDTIISGSLRATDSLLTTTLQTKILNAPTESNGPSYGPGSNNNVLKSNATSIFWGTLTKSEVGLGSVENTALSTWTGTNKITTLGTVTTGTWSATKINPNKGGTGIDSYTKGDILYAGENIANTATTALSKLAIGTAGYTLQATANGPAWTQTVAVANGGTGITTTDPHKVLIGPSSGSTAAAPTWRKPLVADLDVYTGTQTAQVTTSPYQSALWNFNYSRSATSFTTGDVILIKTPGGGGSYGVFLSLDNGTTYRPVCISGATRLTTHFTSGVILMLTYDSAGQANGIYGKVDANGTLSTTTGTNNVGGGCWRVLNLYDSGNSNDTGTLVRDYGGNVPIVTTTAALYRYKLLLSLTDTNYGWKAVPVNTTNATSLSDTAQNTGKTTIYTGEFNPFGDIYYYSSTTNISANVPVRADSLWKTYPVDIRYSFNCSNTLATSKDVYIVAYMTGPCKAKLRNPSYTASNATITGNGPLTQTLPTTADGYIYIRLGRAYSTTTVDISIDHPIYYHDGVSIQRLSQTASYGTTLPSNGREGQLFYQISDPWYELPGGGGTGQVLTKRSNADRDVTWTSVATSGGAIMRPDSSTKYYVTGSASATENTDAAIFNTAVYVENSVLMGAAWNDYAEYRRCTTRVEPGRCIIENGDGTLSPSVERLQAGAEIVSDTFGFAIGKTTESGTPIAVSGRVLAYINEDLKDIKVGAPVCSGPNGTVSQMTEHEARKYPWLIIGTVSSIPKEEEWGENKVKVNGRVWIRVR